MNYYIQGDKEKADQIKAAFENKGYSDKGFTFDVNDILFFTANNKHINVCPANGWLANIIKTHPDYKELELPKPHYDIANFHAGMPVLVRYNNRGEWRYVPFSHIITNGSWKFNAVGMVWQQCVPFEGNEHLLGTTDMCDEQYINW